MCTFYRIRFVQQKHTLKCHHTHPTFFLSQVQELTSNFTKEGELHGERKVRAVDLKIRFSEWRKSISSSKEFYVHPIDWSFVAMFVFWSIEIKLDVTTIEEAK